MLEKNFINFTHRASIHRCTFSKVTVPDLIEKLLGETSLPVMVLSIVLKISFERPLPDVFSTGGLSALIACASPESGVHLFKLASSRGINFRALGASVTKGTK